MHFPKMGLTREELKAILTTHLFQQDRDSEDGREALEKLKYLRKNIHLFTDEMLNEKFSKMVFQSSDDIGLKVDLRMALLYEAKSKNEITTAEYISVMSVLGATLQQLSIILEESFDAEYDDFPHIEIDLEKPSVIVDFNDDDNPE